MQNSQKQPLTVVEISKEKFLGFTGPLRSGFSTRIKQQKVASVLEVSSALFLCLGIRHGMRNRGTGKWPVAIAVALGTIALWRESGMRSPIQWWREEVGTPWT